jgi:hypothetical protein
MGLSSEHQSLLMGLVTGSASLRKALQQANSSATAGDILAQAARQSGLHIDEADLALWMSELSKPAAELSDDALEAVAATGGVYFYTVNYFCQFYPPPD